MLAAISFVTTPQAVANVRLADVRMATSWYDSGQRLDGAVAAAPPPVTTTAAVSAGASPVDRKFSGSNIYEPGSTAPWGFQSRARRSDDPVFKDLRALATAQNPVIGYYDPLDLASADLSGEGDAASVGFLRHAEMKHGRIAMFGFVGYIVHENGYHWPWPLSYSLPDYSSFEGLSAPAVWDALPEASKYQIIALIGCFEIWSENSAVLARQGQAHYMRGGKPGFFPAFRGQSLKELGVEPSDTTTKWEGPTALFPAILHPVPLNFFDPLNVYTNMSAEKKAQKLNVEINNGRLAMIGLAGFIAEATVPGSVPLLEGVVKHYDGNVMQPFMDFL